MVSFNTFTNGLFVELKVGKNTLTEAQKEVREQLLKERFLVAICYGVDDFVNTVNSYLNYKLEIWSKKMERADIPQSYYEPPDDAGYEEDEPLWNDDEYEAYKNGDYDDW